MRLVIVDRKYPDIFRALAIVLHAESDGRLIWDRRRLGDRRTADRNASDRRDRPERNWLKNPCVVLHRDSLLW
jgi:hypothetical protein